MVIKQILLFPFRILKRLEEDRQLEIEMEVYRRIENLERPFTPQRKRKGRKMMGKLRAQIFLAILCLTVLAGIGAYQGFPELATATIGGIIALGMKVLENE